MKSKRREKYMWYVPIIEFRHHIEKWLEVSQHYDIIITRYGKPICVVIGYERWMEIKSELENLDVGIKPQ
jgi:prevent-host-death family protein